MYSNIIHNSPKVETMRIKWWTDNQNAVYPRSRYKRVITRNETPTYATTWRHHENITPSERTSHKNPCIVCCRLNVWVPSSQPQLIGCNLTSSAMVLVVEPSWMGLMLFIKEVLERSQRDPREVPRPCTGGTGNWALTAAAPRVLAPWSWTSHTCEKCMFVFIRLPVYGILL